MARLSIVLALAFAACVVGQTRAAAAKGRRPNSEHPDYPQPIQPAEPCHIKKLPCVPVYTEEDAERLAKLGDFRQVAIAPSFPMEMPAPSKRKTPPCRRGDCRRKQNQKRLADVHQQGRQHTSENQRRRMEHHSAPHPSSPQLL